jgi:hypothetical protein
VLRYEGGELLGHSQTDRLLCATSSLARLEYVPVQVVEKRSELLSITGETRFQIPWFAVTRKTNRERATAVFIGVDGKISEIGPLPKRFAADGNPVTPEVNCRTSPDDATECEENERSACRHDEEGVWEGNPNRHANKVAANSVNGRNGR